MHAEVECFLDRVRIRLADAWRGPVLELGSMDVNGSPRALFPDGTEYLGVDIEPGRGVDVVGLAHEAPTRPEGWALVISTQALEHDPHWRETLAHAVRVLSPGGVLVVTAAAPGTTPHGLDIWPDGYYRNLSEADLLGAVEAAGRPGQVLVRETIPTPDTAPISCLAWKADG